jgi:hypothetical protein
MELQTITYKEAWGLLSSVLGRRITGLSYLKTRLTRSFTIVTVRNMCSGYPNKGQTDKNHWKRTQYKIFFSEQQQRVNSNQSSVITTTSGFFTFMWSCIVINFFIIKPTKWTNFTKLFWYETFHVYSFRAGSGCNAVVFWSCSKAVYKPVWHIPYTVNKLLMMERGTVRNI